MTEKLQQTIKEEIVKLPKETQDAINKIDWVKIAEEIGKKYSLDENQITKFQTETMLILFSIEYPNLYDNNIEANVGISEEKAKQMAKEAYQKIFLPINNIFIDNIKKNQKDKNANMEQNLNFILSGGDYSAFIAPKDPPLLDKGGNEGRSLENTPPSSFPLAKGEGNQITPPSLQEIKDKLSLKQ